MSKLSLLNKVTYRAWKKRRKGNVHIVIAWLSRQSYVMSEPQARELMRNRSIVRHPLTRSRWIWLESKTLRVLHFMYFAMYIRYLLKPNKIDSTFSHKYLISFWLNLESPCIDRTDFLAVVHKLNGSERRTHWFLTLFSLQHGLWIFTILQALLRRTRISWKTGKKKKTQEVSKTGGRKRQDSTRGNNKLF